MTYRKQSKRDGLAVATAYASTLTDSDLFGGAGYSGPALSQIRCVIGDHCPDLTAVEIHEVAVKALRLERGRRKSGE